MEKHLSQYKIFYTVAKERNISRAAEILYISQPAISKSIRKLESSLDTTLFFRNSRGVQLTDEGEVLYRHVKIAFDALNSGEEQLKQISTLGIGHLRIGVSTTLCKYVLLPYLKTFIAAYPHIRISIECQSTKDTLQLLNDGSIDIGLVGEPHYQKYLEFHSLGEIEDIFVATDSYIENLQLRDPKCSDNIFESATLMLLDKENMTRQYIDDYLLKNKILPQNSIEVTTMDLLIEFSKISLGVACVIKEFVEKDLANGTLIELPLACPLPRRKIGFAYLTNHHQSQALQAFTTAISRGNYTQYTVNPDS